MSRVARGWFRVVATASPRAGAALRPTDKTTATYPSPPVRMNDYGYLWPQLIEANGGAAMTQIVRLRWPEAATKAVDLSPIELRFHRPEDPPSRGP